MCSLQIFNLDVGDPRRLIGTIPFRVGPFRLELVEEYPRAVSQLYQPEQLHVQIAGPVNQLTRNVTRTPESPGGWVVTANATIEEGSSESSVLCRFTTQDGGVRDLCEILTFLTGRRVITDGMQQFCVPDAKLNASCVQEETFAAAAIAWANRSRISRHGMQYAVLLENAAIDQRMMQVRAYLHNAVLNILVDKWPSEEIAAVPNPNRPTLPRAVRTELASCVERAVRDFDGLTSDLKEAYIPVLRAKVQQGPWSLHDDVLRLLQYDLGILPVQVDEAVVRRVKFMNRVRNHMTHSGQMPELPGLQPAVSDRYTAVIVGGVVPAINQLALGRLFGFTVETVGSLSQQPLDLQRFFMDGNWRGQPLDLMSFEEWVNSPEVLI